MTTPSDPGAFSSRSIDDITNVPRQGQRLFPRHTGPESIGWGIIGTGERARQVVPNAIQQQPPLASEIASTWAVGVYSHSNQRAREFATDLYLPHSFTNLADLLKRREIQCVYIASHPRHHFPFVMAALTAGKHVLCEPPLALSLEEAQTLQLTAEHRGLLLAVAFQLRADPAIQQLKQMLADQMIGDLLGGRITNTTPLYRHQQSWRLQPQAGGVLRNRTPHSLDLLHYLLDDEIASIYSSSSLQFLNEEPNPLVDEDVQTLVTLHTTKLTIQLHDSFFIPHIPTLFELYGTRGTVQIQHWADPSRPSRLVLIQNHHAEPLPVPPSDATRQLIAAFLQVVRSYQMGSSTTSEQVASAGAGVKSVQLMLAARQALHSNTVVAF